MLFTEQVSVVQAKILKELLEDGRKSNQEIAKKTGLPEEIIKVNYNELEKIGVITGATIHINYKSFGYKAVAHILITVNSEQSNQLIEYLQKMPAIYSVYSRGTEGSIDVVAMLKTLGQLNDIKDTIKRHFSISEIRTAIWTDVKEMNYNLAIITDNTESKGQDIPYQISNQTKNKPQTIIIDQINQKIADKLSENGRVPIETLAKEIGVSPNVAKKRYEELKKNGVLKVTIQINPTKIGYQAMCVFFAVTLKEKSFLITEKVSRIPDIISIMKTTGDYDLQIWAMIKDIGQLLSIREELGKIRGILKIDMEVVRVLDKWPTPRQYISTF